MFLFKNIFYYSSTPSTPSPSFENWYEISNYEDTNIFNFKSAEKLFAFYNLNSQTQHINLSARRGSNTKVTLRKTQFWVEQGLK